MTRVLRLASSAALLAALAGCVVAPAPPAPAYGYGYGYGPAYYAPAYYAPAYVYPPPISVGVVGVFGGHRRW